MVNWKRNSKKIISILLIISSIVVVVMGIRGFTHFVNPKDKYSSTWSSNLFTYDLEYVDEDKNIEYPQITLLYNASEQYFSSEKLNDSRVYSTEELLSDETIKYKLNFYEGNTTNNFTSFAFTLEFNNISCLILLLTIVFNYDDYQQITKTIYEYPILFRSHYDNYFHSPIWTVPLTLSGFKSFAISFYILDMVIK